MSKRRWALPVPLHLKADDNSPDASELRFHLFQYSVHVTGGRGFRQPKGTGSKRKRFRRGWGVYDGALGRPNALMMQARYGERHAQ